MLAHSVLREYQKLGRQVAAMRPAILAGGEAAAPDTDGRGAGKPAGRAKSAAQARRERMGKPSGKP